MTHPMPASMEKVMEDARKNIGVHECIVCFEDGVRMAYEAIIKNARVVGIPKDGCLFCEFDGITHEYCRAYRDIKTKYKRPDFCKAKSVTIILNEG